MSEGEKMQRVYAWLYQYADQVPSDDEIAFAAGHLMAKAIAEQREGETFLAREYLEQLNDLTDAVREL